MRGALVVIVLAAAFDALAQATSASYRLVQSTFDAGGAVASAPTHRLTGSFGQESAIGTASTFDSVLQAGFWSYLGSGLVPVILTMSKNAIDPADLDLVWTGNDPPYAIFASTKCSAVTESFLASAPANTYLDSSRLDETLVCYNVFATAPGPVAPK